MTIECPNLETSLSAGLSEFYLFGATTNVENPLKMLMFHNVSSEIELGPKVYICHKEVLCTLKDEMAFVFFLFFWGELY